MNITSLRSYLGHPEVPDNGNFYALKQMDKHPDKLALKYPILKDNKVEYIELSFGEFRNDSLKWANGLKKSGFDIGDRIILLIPVSVELYELIFACFYIGVTPVFIDISMGTKKLIKSIKDSRAKGIISVDQLLKYKYFVPAMWFKHCFSLDRKRFLIHPMVNLKHSNAIVEPAVKLLNNSPALITFTSGSTGRPKGANRTIEVLLNQKIVSEYMWPHREDEIDMPAFPMIVLQNLGCGVSSVLPALNFSNYLEMNPEIIANQIDTEKVTRFSAQPYFIERLSLYLIESKRELNSVRSLVVGGATVSKRLSKLIIKAFPNAEANIVYGSTEAEPIAAVDMKEFIHSDGRGLLLGKVVETLSVKILNIENKPTPDKSLEPYKIGEICLSGCHVIKEYIDNHPANLELKLRDESDQVWHRTGDLGYFDDKNNLWMVGRIKDRIESDHGLIPCYDLEERLLEFTFIKRAAFINSNKTLFLTVEDNFVQKEVEKFLIENKLSQFKIRVIDSMPVDKRHFSRVDRAELEG